MNGNCDLYVLEHGLPIERQHIDCFSVKLTSEFTDCCHYVHSHKRINVFVFGETYGVTPGNLFTDPAFTMPLSTMVSYP